jgi:hypothetical protein
VQAFLGHYQLLVGWVEGIEGFLGLRRIEEVFVHRKIFGQHIEYIAAIVAQPAAVEKGPLGVVS